MTDQANTTTIGATSPQTTRLPERKSVGFSMGRVMVVAANTFVEAIRQKVYNILLVIGLLIIVAGPVFRQLSIESAQLKTVQDVCLGVITVVGLVIAIVGTAQLLPREVENRTIYTILAKPVRRFEFLLGKYLGSILLILMTLLVMTIMSGIVLMVVERALVAQAMARAGTQEPELLKQTIANIQSQAYNPDLIKALILIFIKLLLMAGVTLLFSTFSTSMIFNVVMAIAVYFAGYLRGFAQEVWSDEKWLMMILAIIPDLSAFNVADDVVLGKAVDWMHTFDGTVYGLARTGVIILAAYLIFTRREI